MVRVRVLAIPAIVVAVTWLEAGGIGQTETGVRRAPAPSDLCADRRVPAGLLPAQHALLQQECAVIRAVNGLDAKALRPLLADDFSLVTTSGRIVRGAKAEMVMRWTATPRSGERSETRLIELSHVTIQGPSGWVVGTIADHTITDSGETCQAHAFTDIWHQHKGTWQWVHAHESGLRTVDCATTP